MKTRRFFKYFIVSLFLFLTTSAIGTILHLSSVKQQVQANRSRYYNIVENQAHLIDNIIDKIVIRLNFIENLIILNEGDISFFDETAPRLYNQIYNEIGLKLRNFALAPDGVVTDVYPLQSNEVMLGFDYKDLNQPGNDDAYLAYSRGRTVVTIPFELLQGGVGVAIRTPVYLNPEEKEGLWGLIAVTMNFDEFIKILELDYFDTINVKYEFCYADKSSRAVVITSNADNLKNPVSYPVMQNNLNMFLRIEPKQGWDDRTQTVLFELLIIIGCFFISVLMYNSLKIKALNDDLHKMVQYDPLAKCYSRSFLTSSIVNSQNGKWIDESKKYSLGIIDIDDFKKINDTYGHEFGDRVIESVSYLLKKVVLEKNSGYIVRYGGDEFLLLLTCINKNEFESILQDCTSLISEIAYEEAPDFNVAISIGGAFHETDESYDKLFKIADRNLYISKQNGKNRYTI
ncbi:MAG: sensor domain-containing diguanylate cyclase [Treponema sp.]|nr:sensor domain-containing diguanylate cyclase [Treponema sp.]